VNSKATPSQACLLLGSNIAPEQNLPKAIALLRHYVEVADTSKVWETPAVGSSGANFLNAAVMVRTHLKPEQ
jgi:2-amino-4-hydroxy-6-hydroxymethyldihydropteridine diphosphokinase